MRNAYIAMGANLPSSVGTPEETLCTALDALCEAGNVISQSSLYCTEPVGLVEQPAFLNAVVLLEINNSMTPHSLLDELLRIERQFGRDRAVELSMGPRSLDLDLLLADDLVLSTVNLTLPHPRLHERAFVLVPLAEIAPDLHHPVFGVTMKNLLKKLKYRTDQVVRVNSNIWQQ